MALIIVGGGLVGCAVAWEFARRKQDVLVLERAVPGAEASSAAAGILAPRLEAHGHAEARALGLRSLGLWESWQEQLSDVGYRRCGVLALGADAPDSDAIRVEGGQLRRLAAGLAAEQAWFLPDEGCLDTRRVVGAVREAAVAAGARFRSGCTVGRVEADAVVLQGGERVPGTVIVCAGAWTGVVPGVEVPVRPVRGQLAALGAVGAVHAVVFGAGGYVVPRHDETVVGATAEEVGFERGTTAGGLHHVLGVAVELLPELRAAPLLRHWSSFRPGSPDGLPILGEVHGAWVAGGHFRNGILLAPLTARLLADRLLDGEALPSAWSPGRFARGAA